MTHPSTDGAPMPPLDQVAVMDCGESSSNVLRLPHGNSEVVGVVRPDEVFLTHIPRGSVFVRVRTLDGVEGYMTSEDIRTLSNGEALLRHFSSGGHLRSPLDQDS